MKEIELIFTRRRARLTATLLEDQAPETCRAVWSVLGYGESLSSMEGWPGGGRVRQARYAGPELFVFIPPPSKIPPVENQTFRPIPGDVMFVSVSGPRTGLSETVRHARSCEIAIFYDRNADLEVKHAPGVEGVGWVGSRFARVPDGQLEKLLEVGTGVWNEGPERAVIRRRR